MVEDKNLAKVMHALAGLILNMEGPQPVSNAKLTKGKVTAVSDASTLFGKAADALRSSSSEMVTTKELKIMLIDHGGSETSLPYLLKKLQEIRVLKHTKVKGTYGIIKEHGTHA
jgi:hypothetical protein